VFPDNRIVNLSELLEQPLTVRDGAVLLSERPGIGVTPDEDKVAAYAIDAWS